MKTLILSALFIISGVATTKAICIGCGCNSSYNDCVSSGTDDCPIKVRNLSTGEWSTTPQSSMKTCCQVGLRNCHSGFGIGGHWWGAIITDPNDPNFVDFPSDAMGSDLYVAFSVNGNIFGSHDGGQVIKSYNLLTQDELNQIAYLQPIINKFLNGLALTHDEMIAIN